MKKDDYEYKMKTILGDMCTYRRLKRDPTSGLQTKNNKLVEKLFKMNILNANEKYKLTSRTATAPRIYGLPKIHKEGTPLRPICSSINSPTYNVSKYITDILKNLTKDSKYNIKDGIEFKKRINQQTIHDNELLISFDVVSLFPSVPINLAIRTIKEKWTIIQEFTKIPMDLFLGIVTLCIKDFRYFTYDDKIFEQTKGMPMGSPISPIVADIIMEELLDDAMNKLSKKPKFLTKYVDDIFCIIDKDEIDNTLTTLNAFNRQLQFTMECENEGKLPYLDTVVQRHNNQLRLNWYQKNTASGRLINFHSNHPRRIKINTATNFINRVLNISDVKFHKANEKKIRQILQQNVFPNKTISDLLKYVKNKKRYK
ncbi:uncharacterized protein LOC142235921 [Haematobia irritans]|uniref:uncharacterized protein LOC142235921 n=1 Tax=Haematobia irritans TaxID=7368 RepID=UPI003F4FF5EF